MKQSRTAFLLVVFFSTTFIAFGTTEKDSTKAHQVSRHIITTLNTAPTGTTTFTEVASLTGLLYGGMDWGDYDNDGDLDLVVTGNVSDPNSPIEFTKLYKNNGGVFTEDTNNTLKQLASGSVDWGDYDNDGDIDLLLTGLLPSDPTQPTTTIYTNNNGILTELPNVSIPPASRGTCNWVDWDNDGDLDIFISGWTNTAVNSVTYITKFYRNNNGSFDLFPYNVQPAFDGDVVWNDIDGDRDFDLLVTGSIDITTQWINNVENPFSTTGSLDGLSSSSAAWGDFDNDGDQDLIVSGTKNNSNVGTVAFYKNNGTGLVSAGASGLIAHYESSMSIGDFDNDGDLDVIMTGFTSPSSPLNTTLFTNDGTGNFALATNTGLTTPVRNGETRWGDYDNDGDLDLIVCGSNATWDVRYTKIYRNDLGIVNTPPTTPTGLTSTQTDTEVIFSWNAASDAQGGKVSYNLRIGTTPGGSEIMSASSDLTTGFHRLAKPGNVKNALSWRVKKLTASGYYWSVQAIDNAGKAGAFSTEVQTVMQLPVGNFAADPGYSKVNLTWTNPNTTGHFVIYREIAATSNPTNIITTAASGTSYTDASVTNGTTYYYYIKAADDNGNTSALQTASATPEFFSLVRSLYIVEYGSAAWGDFDGDGDYDVAVTGYQSANPTIKLYRNSNGTFTEEQGPALVSGTLTYASWNDYDNDNDLDLLLTGVTEPSSYLFKNSGGTFSAAAGTNLPVAHGLKHAWADFDNDGYTDLGIPGNPERFLLKNNGSSFSQYGSLSAYLSMAWGDYNNDGDMDYAAGDGIYDNVNGVFTKIFNLSVYGALAWADIDNDGDLDLIPSSITVSGIPKAVIYRNDGTTFTQVDQPNMIPLTGDDPAPASISAGDYDNDGDLDLLMTGIASNSPYTTGAGVYINNGSGLFSLDSRIDLQQASSSNATWGDLDRDGDLDLLICGRATTQNSDNFVNKIIRNNLNAANNPPTVPTGLQGSVSNSKITFSWNASTDTEGGPITYNLRVGTTPGGSDVMSAMANTTTGRLLTPSAGNVQLNRSWSLSGIGPGTYYWSVQSIDGAFRESTFASEQQLVVNGQNITFAELATVKADQTPFALNATASSGLPVSFSSSNPLVATISGNQVTIVSAGTTSITASQPGNSNFLAAPPVARVLTVTKLDQSITFTTVATKTVGNAAFTLSATASSTLPIQFATTSDKITLSGNSVTILKAGSVTVTAAQVGNGNYNAASTVSQTFCINPAKPTIAKSGLNTENVVLTSSATSGNQWFLDGSAIALATDITFHPVTAGMYTVKSTVDNCSSELSDAMILIVTGILKNAESQVRIYPNPVTSELTIELPAGGISSTLQVFHMDGRAGETLETTEEKVEWNVGELAAGLYIMRVIHDGKIEHHKFIKR